MTERWSPPLPTRWSAASPSRETNLHCDDRQLHWSAFDRVVQVQHAVTLDHLVGVVEEDGAGVAAEEPHPVAEDHWGGVHRHLVDEARRERLPAHVARAHGDQTVPGELLGERHGGLD